MAQVPKAQWVILGLRSRHGLDLSIVLLLVLPMLSLSICMPLQRFNLLPDEMGSQLDIIPW